jgi:hypothetical protein
VQRQEGIFTYFTRPDLYFIQYGCLPAIESYCMSGEHEGYFELLKFNIERNPLNMSYIKNHLKKLEIDHEYLLCKK